MIWRRDSRLTRQYLSAAAITFKRFQRVSVRIARIGEDRKCERCQSLNHYFQKLFSWTLLMEGRIFRGEKKHAKMTLFFLSSKHFSSQNQSSHPERNLSIQLGEPMVLPLRLHQITIWFAGTKTFKRSVSHEPSKIYRRSTKILA